MNAAREPRQPKPNTPPSPLLTAALAYAARGVPVFPLIPGDKKPASEHGLLDATTDEQQIRAWWRTWRSANIGVPTGRASGWLAIDIDTKHGATYDTLAALGPLPPTLTAQTATGGLHLVFAYPDASEVRNSASKIADGIDVRGEGGYIVVAPSRRPDGQYEWVSEDSVGLAMCPQWLIDCATAKPKPPIAPTTTRKPIEQPADASDRDAHWLAWALALARPGTSDETGFKLAQQLLLDPGVRDCDAVLRRYAREASFDARNPFTDADVSRWLSSAAGSQLVARGEPARNPKAKPALPKKPRKAVTQANDAMPAPQQDETPHTERPPLRVLPKPGEGDSGAGDEPPTDDDALLKGEADDNGNAETMYRLFGRRFLYTPAYGWLEWVGTHWRPTEEAIVNRAAIITLKKRRHAAVEAEAENIVKATKADKSRISGCVFAFRSYVIEPNVGVFDADPDALNCQNGVLNLRTGELTPHHPSQRFTYCVPVAYDPYADRTAWEAFVLDALGQDQDTARYFQLCAGYSLTGHTREEKMFYLYGPPRAGKGTITETFLELLPRPLSSEVDFSSFTAQRDNDSQNFDLAALKPARVVIASESNKYQSLNPAKIKMLTGGNHINCAFKHKDMFTYRPQFKVWLVSNHPVTADAEDEALWGRVQVFTFPHSHLGSEDVTLKARMKAPETLLGVLAWAVAGALRWYALEASHGHLAPPQAIVDATTEHREKQDFIKLWIGDACTLDGRAWSRSAALRQSYEAWCEENGVKPMRANDFAESLTTRFGCVSKREAGTGARGYNGIRLGVTPE